MLNKVKKVFGNLDGFLLIIVILIGNVLAVGLIYIYIKLINWFGFYGNSAIAIGLLLPFVFGYFYNLKEKSD